MYRLKRPTDQHLIIKHYPFLQKSIGLLFILGGFCVAYLVFPTLVVFHCERAENVCSLNQSNPFHSVVNKIALSDITGAKLDTQSSEGTRGTSYVIRIETRQGDVPFTPYGIGSGDNSKTDAVSRINAFLKDPAVTTFEVVEDERLPFTLFSTGLVLFGLLPLCFVRTVTCRLDISNDRFILKGGGVWGLKKVDRRLSDLVDASVGAASEGGYRMCRVVFRFASGERIPLTYYRYRDSKQPRKIVKEIKEFIAHR
jgi:hypothetical protein